MLNQNLYYLRKAESEHNQKPTKKPIPLEEEDRQYGVHELKGEDMEYPVQPHPEEKCHLNIGGIKLPHSSSEEHVLFDGCPGSGKTMMLRVILQSILGCMQMVGGLLIANDYKGDLYQKLKYYAQTHGIPFYYFNPNSSNSFCWDVAKDVGNDFEYALELLSILIPSSGNLKDSDFWQKAAIVFAETVLKVFVEKCPGKWGIHDLYNGCFNDEEIVRKFVNQISSNHYAKNALYENKASEAVGSVQLTLYTALASVKLLAKYQYYAQTAKTNRPPLVSLKEILEPREGGAILLFGHDNAKMYSAVPCIQAMFKVIVDRLLAKKDVPSTPDHYHTWICWDEFAEYKHLPRVVDLLNKSRSKKVSLYMVVQHFAQLEAIYKEQAAEFAQCCNFKFYMRSGDIKNATWKSKQTAHIQRITRTTSVGRDGSSNSYRAERIPAFREEFFLNIPPFKPGVDLNLALVSQYHGCLQLCYANEVIMGLQLLDPPSKYPEIDFNKPDFPWWNPNEVPLMGYRSVRDKFIYNNEGISEEYEDLNIHIRKMIYEEFKKRFKDFL